MIFVTHAYETVFLIRERESNLLRVARLERMQAEAELGALRAQIDPHFLSRTRRAAPSVLDPHGGRLPQRGGLGASSTASIRWAT